MWIGVFWPRGEYVSLARLRSHPACARLPPRGVALQPLRHPRHGPGLREDAPGAAAGIRAGAELAGGHASPVVTESARACSCTLSSEVQKTC